MSTLERLISRVDAGDVAGMITVINTAEESNDVDTMDSIVRRGFIHAIRLRKYSMFIAMWNCYVPAYDPLGVAYLLKPIIDDQFAVRELASTDGCDPADDAVTALKTIQNSGILREYFTSYTEILEMLSEYY